MALALLLKRPNLLAYPGGNPGFNPSHVAANGISGRRGFSGVASGAGMISLLTGKPASLASTFTGSIGGLIGPGVSSTSATSKMTFTGAVGPEQKVTIASIFTWVAGHDGTLFSSSSGQNQQPAVYINGTTNVFEAYGVTNVLSSGLVVTAGVPYLGIVSFNAGGSSYFLLKNLLTGQVRTATTGDIGTSVAGTGLYIVGADGFSGDNFAGNIATMMYAPVFMTLPQMIAWSADPWSFWYPRRLDLSMMLKAPSTPTLLVSATQSWASLRSRVEIIGAD